MLHCLIVSEFQQRLCRLYETRLNTVMVSPLVADNDEVLRDFYVPPRLVEINHKRRSNDDENDENKKKPAISYRQVFHQRRDGMQMVVLVGEAGMGKSTFAAKCAVDWAGRWFRSERNSDTAGDELTQQTNEPFSDMMFWDSVEFVFYVMLREACHECNVVRMLQDQLMGSLFPDVNATLRYRMLTNVLTNRRCVVLADGLDEWNHPDGVACACAIDNRATPLLLAGEGTTVLFTSRPWRMAHSRVRHSAIDVYVEIQGMCDYTLLVRKAIMNLVGPDEQKIETETNRCVEYIKKNEIEHLTSVPILTLLFVCLRVEGDETAQTMGEIHSNILNLMFKKYSNESALTSNDIQTLPGLRNCEYAIQNSRVLMSLAKVAVEKLTSKHQESCLQFTDVDITSDQLAIALGSGILRARKAWSLTRPLTQFSFLHKSVQEFLAAVYLACRPQEIQTLMSPLMERGNIMTDLSQVFIFLSGMNADAAREVLALMVARVPLKQVLSMLPHCEFESYYSRHRELIDLQNTVICGFIESQSSGLPEPELNHFIFNSCRKRTSVLMRLLSNRKDSVKSIHIRGKEREIDVDTLQDVFELSTDSLLAVDLWHRGGRYDLANCHRLRYVNIQGNCTKSVRVNAFNLETCILYDASSQVEYDMFNALTTACQLHHLVLANVKNVELMTDVLLNLPTLRHLYLFHTDLSHNQTGLVLPNSIACVGLMNVKLQSMHLRHVIDHIYSLPQSVQCYMAGCTFENEETVNTLLYLQQHPGFLINKFDDYIVFCETNKQLA